MQFPANHRIREQPPRSIESFQHEVSQITDKIITNPYIPTYLRNFPATTIKRMKKSQTLRPSYKKCVDRSSQYADDRLSGEGTVGEFRKCRCRAKQTNLELRATLRVTIAQTRAETSETYDVDATWL